MIKGKQDKALVSLKRPVIDLENPDAEGYSIYRMPEIEVMQDQRKLENEMNAMFKELDEIENMIKGNKDLD